jgi:hypothetical protein
MKNLVIHQGLDPLDIADGGQLNPANDGAGMQHC